MRGAFAWAADAMWTLKQAFLVHRRCIRMLCAANVLLVAHALKTPRGAVSADSADSVD